MTIRNVIGTNGGILTAVEVIAAHRLTGSTTFSHQNGESWVEYPKCGCGERMRPQRLDYSGEFKAGFEYIQVSLIFENLEQAQNTYKSCKAKRKGDFVILAIQEMP